MGLTRTAMSPKTTLRSPSTRMLTTSPIAQAKAQGIFGGHVDVPLRTDHALFEPDLAFGAFQDQAWAASQVARHTHRGVDAQAILFGARDLDLGLAAYRAQHADAVDAPAGTDEVELFFAGKLAGLGQGRARREFVPWAKELFQVLRAEVDVVRRNADRDGDVLRLDDLGHALVARAAGCVSRAIMRAHSVWTTRTLTLESGCEMSATRVWFMSMARFLTSSIRMPRCHSPCMAIARMPLLPSPTPAVKTRVSRPPSATK